MKPPLPPPPQSYCRSHRLLGPVLHKLRLSCANFAELSLQALDRPLAPGEKIRYISHFIVCSMCRKVEKQMRSLTLLVRTTFAARELQKPSPEFLDSVRSELTRISGRHD